MKQLHQTIYAILEVVEGLHKEGSTHNVTMEEWVNHVEGTLDTLVRCQIRGLYVDMTALLTIPCLTVFLTLVLHLHPVV